MSHRILDISLALLGMLVFSPLMILSALLIFLYDRQDILFFQERIGQYGKPFTILKFRTMHRASVGPVFTLPKDPRITPIGRFLRRYKLDELPQLFNVIKGDMSFVGPRPQVPQVMAWLEEKDRQRLLSVRPGITDHASIAFINEDRLLADSRDPQDTYQRIILPQKVELSLSYLEHRSLRQDIKIILSTIFQTCSRISER